MKSARSSGDGDGSGSGDGNLGDGNGYGYSKTLPLFISITNGSDLREDVALAVLSTLTC